MSEETVEKKPRAKKEPTFEEALSRLNAIAETLEGGSPSLSDAQKLYEEGAALIAKCTEQLENAKATVKTVTK